MKNPTIRLILGVFLAIVLSITMVLEIRATFNTLFNKFYTDLDKISNISMTSAMSSVTIDTVQDFEEVPNVNDDGDVIKIHNWNIRIKVNGRITENNSELGIYTFTSLEDQMAKQLVIEEKSDKLPEVLDALSRYWYGETSNIIEASGVEVIGEEEPEYYQSSSMGKRVPVIHSTVTANWYMFIPAENEESYLVLTSSDPFKLVDEQATAHFDDPSVNYQDKHTYSLYEEWATTATIKELMSEEGARTKQNLNVDEYANKDQSSLVASSNKELKKLRNAKAKLSTVVFNSAGKAEDGTTLDITSDEAKKSQWLLSSDTYYYTLNGLSVYTLSARRSRELFSLSGTIENTTSTQRPYVILIKYLDGNNKLLGIKVVDKRNSPLNAGTSTAFTVDVTPTQDKIEISKIESLMFEMY